MERLAGSHKCVDLVDPIIPTPPCTLPSMTSIIAWLCSLALGCVYDISFKLDLYMYCVKHIKCYKTSFMFSFQIIIRFPRMTLAILTVS